MPSPDKPRGNDVLQAGDVISLGSGEKNRAKISPEEFEFAKRLWRTRIRELRDLAHRYGFDLRGLDHE